MAPELDPPVQWYSPCMVGYNAQRRLLEGTNDISLLHVYSSPVAIRMLAGWILRNPAPSTRCIHMPLMVRLLQVPES